jgi:hypothetical protein
MEKASARLSVSCMARRMFVNAKGELQVESCRVYWSVHERKPQNGRVVDVARGFQPTRSTRAAWRSDETHRAVCPVWGPRATRMGLAVAWRSLLSRILAKATTGTNRHEEGSGRTTPPTSPLPDPSSSTPACEPIDASPEPFFA